MSLKLSETSEMTQAVFLAIVKDCVENNWVTRNTDSTKKENKKYRAITKKAREGGGFWGGYAYLDEEPYDEKCDFTGFIRLYSPMGSGKWGFEVKGDEVNVYHG